MPSLRQDDHRRAPAVLVLARVAARMPVIILVLLALLALCQLLFAFAGVSAPFFSPFEGLRQIFPPDSLPQLALIFVQLPLLFFVNFAIFFGPFLFFAVRQIRGYEPGDASWGVKIDDVRGQAEAKEEITRVITLWQSGEEFEKAGGKRERGLLFLGAPGTGKTMISKAIATNFNCPFVTIPGSGFAGMFIGMDAITVQFLARKARKLAAQVGRPVHRVHRRDRRGRDAPPGARRPASAPPPPSATSIHDLCFFGPNGSITSSGRPGDRVARVARAAVRPARRVARHRLRDVRRSASTERIQRFYPGFGMGGGMGGMALNQLLVVMDGIDEPPLMRKVFTNKLNTFLDAMFVVPSKVGKITLRLQPPRPRAGADLLHRRVQRADHGARPGADPARAGWAATSGSAPRPRTTGSTSSTSIWARSPTSPISTPTAAATSSPGSPTATRRR